MAATSGTPEEDVLECFLYPKSCYTLPPENVTTELLNEEISKFNQAIESYTKDYMWHRDALNFYPRTKQAISIDQFIEGSTASSSRLSAESTIVPHIYARLRYDEDVGDEWFTVFLIFNLTEKFDGLIARLVDADGEFLLIETAEHLPRWAEPESCQDRVYIFDGRIHVVQDKKILPIEQLKRISENSQNYVMSRDVQEILKKRLSAYPSEIEKRKHKARAFLPEKAASILAQEPGLIAPIIRTIVHSDAIERKVCRAMKYFPPEQRTMVNVNMTKYLYAMSTHCRYTGDPRTGWNFPPTNSPKYNAHLLGIKIACGMEMLVARANKLSKQSEKSDITDEEQWKVYLRRLETSGYFRGTLEGSKEREALKESARIYLMANPMTETAASSWGDNEAARKILEAWKNVKTEDFEMHAQDEASLSPPDDDSWLNVDAAQFEVMLGQHWGQSDKKNPQDVLSLKEKVKGFLNRTSEIDGVEFAGEGADENDTRMDTDDGSKIDFDGDVFDSTLRDILDLVVPGDDGEFDGSSEGSLGGDEDEKGGEMDRYMRVLDSELEMNLAKDIGNISTRFNDPVESNLIESLDQEAGGAGPVGNILGGPVRRLMHLQLQSPTAVVVPDLQS